MGRSGMLRGRQVRAYALGTSAIALGFVLANPAAAQCAPDPTIANGITNCTGTDADGLTVATDGTRVTVAADATVRPGAADAAITVRAYGTPIAVSGLVDGGSKAGVLVFAGEPRTTICTDPYAGASVNYCVPGSTLTIYPSARASITVAEGGSVTGGNAILLRRAGSNTGGSASVNVFNAGTITGTGGEAILSGDAGGFNALSISNTATGIISGGIAGAVSYLTNQGRIDGAGRAAIASTSGFTVENSGTIVSRGSAPTLSAGGYLSLTNATGATIAGSATAISTTGSLWLINKGTIDGSVVSTAGPYQSSTIDLQGGIINGDLRLGAGADTVRARYDAATGRVSSITGAMDGGSGRDTLTIGFDADATIASAVLPTNFELLGLDLSNDATVTIARGFTSGDAVSLSGRGVVINQAELVTRGSAVNGSGSSLLTFTNKGVITATLDPSASAGPNQSAVTGLATVNNDGTITADGGGGANASYQLTNSGTITASGTGATVGYGALINSGVIGSTADAGVRLYSSGSGSSNSGTISGATAGLVLTYGAFTNSGTIIGGTTGVQLSGRLTNAVGGTITGGVASGGSTAQIFNAGTINGNVDFTAPYIWDSNSDVFVDDGGTVNGAVRLGGGDDTLLTDLGGDPARPLAGATGGVDAGEGYDTLRYRVRADAEAVLAVADGFEGLAYEVSNGAALTLTAADPTATHIGLAGSGTVTLGGELSATDSHVIDASIALLTTAAANDESVARDFTVINNGDLTLATTAQSYGYDRFAAIYAGSIYGDNKVDVTNNGTITVTNAPGRYYPATGIVGGTTVANVGTITVSGGGTAISGARDVINTGTITVSGTIINAIGVGYVGRLTNSGTITADSFGVQAGYGEGVQITNHGTIESRRGTAIVAGYYGSVINEAGGTIRGATAIDLSGGGVVINRGTIVGDVIASDYYYGGNLYVADGGTLTGNLRFGSGYDTLMLFGDTGVSGTIDGGGGTNTLVHARRASDVVSLGTFAFTNFQAEGVRALGSDTQVMVRADVPYTGDLTLSGDGVIVNTAAINGLVRASAIYQNDPTTTEFVGPLAFTNEGTIEGGFAGTVRSFTNSGAITGSQNDEPAVAISSGSTLTFANSGSIRGATGVESNTFAVSLHSYGNGAITAGNTGAVTGSMYLSLGSGYYFPEEQQTEATAAILTNSGTINADDTAVSIDAYVAHGTTSRLTLTNDGTIEATGQGGTGAFIGSYAHFGAVGSAAVEVVNTGAIRANAGGSEIVYADWDGGTERVTDPAAALSIARSVITPDDARVATIVNSGTIEATGERSVAILARNTTLDLVNTGTIRGGAGTTLADDDYLAMSIGTPYLAGALQTIGAGDDRIVNSGTIIGSIALGSGDDRIENLGRIEGDVFLGRGDDTFLQRASAVLIGTVDGGAGDNSLIIDASGGGAVNGDQFVNFGRFAQIGEGNVTYSGTFRFDTIGLAGGTITVAAGETLSSAGDVTVTGSDGTETLNNRGTILSAVSMAGGNDRIDNRGTILGAVALGAGNDTFLDYAGSSAGLVDGGAGINRYEVVLSGDRSGIGQRTGFQELAVAGRGTLSLALDQRFDEIALVGTGLNLSLGGFGVGRIIGSDAAETLVVDGDVASIDLGGGDDLLALGTARAVGAYAGGAGRDVLRFTAAGPVLLAGSATGFEQVDLAGNALIISGTLSAIGGLSFGAGDQNVAVSDGGTLAGAIDLGMGADTLRLAAGSVLHGTVTGGAGSDRAVLELAGDRTLAGGLLTDFELLSSDGSGLLTLAGTHNYQRVDAGTDVTVAANAALTAERVQFGGRDDRFTVTGRFAGSVDGGAGTDTIAVTGGDAAAPVAFTGVSNVERYVQSGGFATVAGTAAFGVVDLSGGQLVGLQGSTIGAARFTVGRGATFGSAGTVNGNVAVAGTLSPGASIGTMTVNGNVTLAGTSTSLFEIAATGADKLVVNGALAIDSGATLQLVPAGTLRPGTSYDLVVASGGITGSYATVLKPDSLFGFVVQRVDRIQLLGQFLADPGFSPQVARSIAYANATLAMQPATSDLFAALPALLTASGASDPRRFAQLTPEAYASATQLGVDNALTLAQTARGPGFATGREDPGLFTFAQTVGQWHRLGRDTDEGTSGARAQSYGFMGGIGYGDRTWSVGGFAGYLNSRQQIDGLGARTKSDGFVAGVHGRYAADRGFGFSASLLYDGGEARTERSLPGAGARAIGRYDLHSWVADVSVGYAVDMGGEWALKPKLGVTYMRTTRDDVSEAGTGNGGSAFALDVRRDRHVAGFADGGVTFGRADASDAAFRPSITRGARAQIDGKRVDAVSRYAGGNFDLAAYGASRASLVGTAAGSVAYRFGGGVDLFATASAQTGEDDHQETIMAGVRIGF